MGESFGRSGSLEEVKLGLEEEISFIRSSCSGNSSLYCVSGLINETEKMRKDSRFIERKYEREES